MKIVAMIPARMGSKRVKNKNLRLINGKPLIEYVLDTISKLSIFDEIYINSEHEIFSKIAKKYSMKFYLRPEHLSSDTVTNDEFAYDFLTHVQCDYLIQILPTSPFISESEINNFVSKIVNENLDTLISVEHKQIACVYEQIPLNFNKFAKNPPSQTMEPIKAYATSLMGWKSSNFIKNIENYGVAYHGGDGVIDYFELRGLSTIDIDREEDFQLAEMVALGRANYFARDPQYYCEQQDSVGRVEVDVPLILEKDGVKHNDLFDTNKELVNVQEIVSAMNKNKSWSKRIIDTENNSMTIIAQMPGEGNRRHHHPDWNEWWYILDGEWEWEISGKIKKVKKGDVVFIEKNQPHQIKASGDKLAIRMAVSRADVKHIYQE